MAEYKLKKRCKNKNRDNRDLIEGNTKLQSNQLTKWCFTWNNYEVDKIKTLETKFLEICKKGLFQSEIGEKEKIPHLQGAIWLKDGLSMRWTEFNLPKTIHWEKMINEKDSLKYCQKLGQDGWDGKFRWQYNIPKPLKIIENLKDWQLDCETYCLSEPDGQSIRWYHEKEGGIGKSSFCKYMAVKHNAIVIQGGKLADIMNIIFNSDMDCVNCILIDIPRCHKNAVSYASIECILNGMITNTKYETGRKIFNPPNIVVFSNFPPNISDETLSIRRWKIINLGKEELSEN